ncbi:glycosyltransferase [Sedimenticola selenatireducens]|uniref:glycosyltransferase n=1 Tax=Sedimenticola selenatireducens TaxID=191960 RepID=UPI000686CE0E|nr:glycosyltransferase [Sedimenticola selenatireducens]
MQSQRPQVDVIIPVYRDLAVTRRCIESVLNTSADRRGEVVVVDDASPDDGLSGWCERLSASGRVTLLRNDRNQGFVASVNRAMRHCAGHDVVLLNSDTEVANDWLQRLADTAYAAPDIASVTPFSNNATICSYPYPEWPGGLPGALSLQALDNCFAQANAGAFVDIPTAVGFCMYIRRAALDQVGYFDEAAFGRGYGEENDFCRRALASGWRNVLCAGLFVYHQGSVSFGADKDALGDSAMAVIEQRYPDYLPQVRRFIAQDPLEPLRKAVDRVRAACGDLFPLALLATANSSEAEVLATLQDLRVRGRDEGVTLFCEEEALQRVLKRRLAARHEVIFMPGLWAADGIRRLMQSRYGPVDYVLLHAGARLPPGGPALLHVVHSWGGGVERWVEQFCKADTAHEHYVLSAAGCDFAQGERLLLRRDAPAGELIAEWRLARPIHATALSHSEYRQILSAIIALFGIDRVMLSSLIGHALDALETGLPTIWVAHDHYPWCSSIVHYFEGVCEQCDYDRLQRCLQHNRFDFLSRYYSADEAMLLRQRLRRLVNSEQLTLVAPTRGVSERIGALVPGLDTTRWPVIPHGLELSEQHPSSAAAGPVKKSARAGTAPTRDTAKTSGGVGTAPMRDTAKKSGRVDTLFVPTRIPGERKRALVLGRLHPHKGQQLLQQALPRLTQLCDIVLLGGGDAAHQFESVPGIEIIPVYAHHALEQHVHDINPDFAILASIVPETFSYTLSELWALGVPPLATDIGAFHERITNGEDGLLYSPDADALVQAVQRMVNDEQLLEHIAGVVRDKSPVTIGQMVEAYLDLFTALEGSGRQRQPVSKRGYTLAQFRVVLEALVSPARAEAQHGIAQVEILRQALRVCESDKRELDARLNAIQGSRAWRWIKGLRGFRQRLLNRFGDKR